jgi:hypothetical protein
LAVKDEQLIATVMGAMMGIGAGSIILLSILMINVMVLQQH